ncbi:hypothetical protein TTRE_0000805201 [Trichuris trichiura]|uniref:Uncharacterized protein n=1 Tax=Trichuris trichiura TaxID=36087 RepID=A0A077ZH94_TRITR|nr:hypothetical protein TTRE_0000805201 [Trichuris trichiura]
MNWHRVEEPVRLSDRVSKRHEDGIFVSNEAFLGRYNDTEEAHFCTNYKTNTTVATQDCDITIENFIQCLNGKLAKKLNVLKSELSPSTKQKLANCFISCLSKLQDIMSYRFTCDAPPFVQAKVDYFVQDTAWQTRLNDLFTFVENIDPRVAKCMSNYFVRATLESLGQCVRDVGPDRIKNFYFPSLNIDVDFKFQNLYALHITSGTHRKQIILNRMMVRSKLKDCVGRDVDRTKKMILCLRSAKATDSSEELCSARRSCRANFHEDIYCSSRLDDVLKATCICFEKTAKRAKTLSRGTPLRLIRDGLIGGVIEHQFHQCYTQAGLPFPHQQLEAVKQVFKDSVVDMILRKQIPDALKNAMRLLFDVFKDFGTEWSGILCSDCSSGIPRDRNHLN